MTENPAILFFETAWTAMVEGNLARLEELTHLGPFPCGTDGWVGNHWLSTAVASGNLAAINWVLSKGAEVDYVDNEGFTPLMTALQVEESSQLNQSNPHKSAEDAAAMTIQLIDVLLAAGTDINRGASLAETALHFAARHSSPTVVRHLLACGANPFAYDTEHVPHRPADIAKAAKRWEVAAILSEAMQHPDPDNRA
jgi:ankyrin repeat protein